MLKSLYLLTIILNLLPFTGCTQGSRELKEQKESSAVKTDGCHDFEALLQKQPAAAQLIDVKTVEKSIADI